MQDIDPNQTIFEELGQLAKETDDFKDEVVNCDHDQEATLNFLEIVGEAIKRLFHL